MNNDKNDSNTTIADVKATIAAYREERGWDKVPPRDLAISIVLEAAELLEHFQWGDDLDIEAKRAEIMDEFGDTLSYLIQLAMTLDFDVTTAWREKLEKVKAKYPTSIFNPDKTHDVDAYLKIKKAYRNGKTPSNNSDKTVE